MNSEQDYTTLAKKIKRVRDDLRLVKDAVNPHFGNEYVTLNSVLAELNPLLDRENLLLTQGPQNQGGMPTIQTNITCLDTGDTASWDWPLHIDANPQKTASASSYARRYSLMCIFATAASDDDGESSLGRGSGQQVPLGVRSALKRLQ